MLKVSKGLQESLKVLKELLKISEKITTELDRNYWVEEIVHE